MPTTFNTPAQWRSRAKEARALAKRMRDPESKRALVRVAESYEKIAKRAGARLAAKKANKPTRRISGSLLRTSSPGNKPSAEPIERHVETPTAAKGVEIFPARKRPQKKPRRSGAEG